MLNISKTEEEILKFWQEKKIFEKSLKKTEDKKPFVFYDGPPFATGLPHYGHILSSVIKDVVGRYQTMKGHYVRRRWGWDCHGLPIENLVEKELGVKSKKEIEEKIGVAKFNELCRSKVLAYTKDWKEMVERIGRWVEFDNSYKTMDSTYMESVWWALKQLWEKELIYEGKKVLMYCPHCETPVSKAEVAMDNSYKDVTEEAVIAKFKLKDPESRDLPKDTYILAWTTTPWTLPGNVALAIGEKIDYVLIESDGQNYILAKDRAGMLLDGKDIKILKNFSGSEINGLEYEPLYEIEAVKDTGKNAWFVASANFVNTEDGTGIVHTAVIYGEDDYNLGVEIDLPMVPLLDSKGVFNEKSPEFIKGKYFKAAEKFIKEDLESRDLLFKKENFTHPYPFCWRCETQLFYNAISAWFIDIQKNKKNIVKLSSKANWYPEHLKTGRFLNILADAPDWNISRNRYWATPLPFWKCSDCSEVVCIGSVKELKEKAINFSDVYKTDEVKEIDIHKDKIDGIKIKCPKCQKEISRISEVIDCWVESASMPFAELHYPYENEKLFKNRFPAQYIAEYIAQTRTWFYYMHVVSSLLFKDISFENVVCTGTILNDKGEKLSKSKKNFTDPWIIINQYGVDTLRYYLMSSSVMSGEDLRFNDHEVKDVYNKVVNMLVNTLEFYKMYGTKNDGKEIKKFSNALDIWLMSKLHNLILETTKNLDNYDTIKATRSIKDFIDELSTWYVRRSRERIKEGSEKEKEEASFVLYTALITLSKVMAPILPFLAEYIYSQLKNETDEESVHLCDYPVFNKKFIDKELEEKMASIRNLITSGLSERAALSLRVRQPLADATIKNEELKNEKDLLNLIKEEVNVKEILFDNNLDKDIKINPELTDELREEGIAREIIRNINDIRKSQGLTPKDRVVSATTYPVLSKFMETIMGATKSDSLSQKNEKEFDGEWSAQEMKLGGKIYKVGIKKV